jgi:hypothetical protein
MITSEIQVPSTGPPATAAAAQTTAAAQHAFSFHDFLHIMNPLQYLPVVGTIYRVVTGDVIPEAVRDVGSLLVSGLLGGPIGVATYIAATITEKVTGIDPEKIVAAQLNTATPAKAAPPETPAAPIAPASAAPAQLAWTPHQLAAYGVRSDGSGNLKLGDVGGADVLNNLELVRLDHAAAAYATNQTMPPTAAPRGG